ncbi:MAG: DUF378 domain-containing protein [Patescibacteria group bacterium]|nr:MAG: DUF378 domain-containing protein [Patescibacteria group bacterium]
MMNGKGMCSLHKAAWVLVLVGALNWGLVGAMNYNLVEALLGSWPTVVRVVYILVGVSALMMLAAGKCCMKGGCKCSDGGCGHCGSEQKKPMMGGQPM